MSRPIVIAVAGHTNHGKTSLVRTLAWTEDFGDVADRRAVTRRVEWIDIEDDRNEAIIRLIDTPGLEDSIELRDAIESLRTDSREEGPDLLARFLEDDAASVRFPQPVKALTQMLQADCVLNVIDVRQPVLAKYRDEVEVMRMANPRIVNVLNFTARSSARTDQWRTMLTRGGFGYIASFDVVALRPDDETNLIETIRHLVAHTPQKNNLERFAALRQAQWQQCIEHALAEIAEMLIDAAACVLVIARDATSVDKQKSIDAIKDMVRTREQTCLQHIMAARGIHEHSDPRHALLDLPHDGWQIDVFDRNALKRLATSGGGGAAAGAAAGAVIDLATAGFSLGAGTVSGAALGGLLGAARTHGRALSQRMRRIQEIAVGDDVLQHLAMRQLSLLAHLLQRGHADQRSVFEFDQRHAAFRKSTAHRLAALFHRARNRPQWSSLSESPSADASHDALNDIKRQQLRTDIIDLLRGVLAQQASKVDRPSSKPTPSLDASSTFPSSKTGPVTPDR